ncbi:MAG: NADH:flavin oxidoreductase/NADH oxidase [Alphaproteobacteria bacterium]
MSDPGNAQPKLFTPIDLRGMTARNRIVISPMCQYSAKDGLAGEWHFAHLAKFALGGAGIVFTEAVAVEARGRITHGDLGIWSDAHAKALAGIADFLRVHGAVPAIQLAHAGRKACMQRPWHGNGPIDESDAARGEEPWTIVGPGEEPLDKGWLTPQALTADEIAGLCQAFADAARRADAAGFEIAEVHGAHGYLLHSFLSPLTNKRNDRYGGDRAGRMRFALEVTEAVRAVWPDDKPLFFRVSSVDGIDGGWDIGDSVALARELASLGVDVIDCSSGGLMGSATAARVKRGPGFQVPYAAQIRRETGIKTQAVGLILEARQAEDILEAGDADLIAIGREALYDPFWPHHAARTLGCDSQYDAWPEQYGWWLTRRAKALAASS